MTGRDGLSNGQLTADGVAVPRDAIGVGWTLPPQSTDYRLTAQSPGADVAWTFTSAAPTADNFPAGKFCWGTVLLGLADPCAATPLVFARYTAPVDASNQALSGTRHTLTVTAYHEDRQAPAITELTQQVSFDGGTTWTTARVTRSHTPGTYKATYTVPPLARTDGFVSLRTTATDAGGNTTDQTYRDSYALE